ncbi:hypothetical protein Poli38472_006827 [Pythium oligandrum]|uniref:DUF4246 domain-containing protein n=1 Tax=Pythium oligandrum TaxID=41045 RepID=A0A8K1C694_PYTOL|nr:hypothetical protein Poli38472_006827 [Pythium oligandrum]|eukprot:TMW56817.1 hypothetical protein Poli38472_006827 [Pythium oligandrum]
MTIIREQQPTSCNMADEEAAAAVAALSLNEGEDDHSDNASEGYDSEHPWPRLRVISREQNPRYRPTREVDSDLVFTTITTMPAYQETSQEELRWARYFQDEKALEEEQIGQLEARAMEPPRSQFGTATPQFEGAVATTRTDYLKTFQCITTMPDYLEKSQEELRYEDMLLESHTEEEAVAIARCEVEPTPEEPSTAPLSRQRTRMKPGYEQVLHPSDTGEWRFFVAITAMDAYANKSQEELRVDAYGEFRGPFSPKTRLLPRTIMEIHTRAAIDSMQEKSQSHWDRYVSDDAWRERWLDNAAHNVLRPTLVETIRGWFPVDNPLFTTFVGHETDPILLAPTSEEKSLRIDAFCSLVPFSLDWIDLNEIVGGLAAPPSSVQDEATDTQIDSLAGDKRLADALKLDAYAFVGFYCSMVAFADEMKSVAADLWNMSSIYDVLATRRERIATETAMKMIRNFQTGETIEEAVEHATNVTETRSWILRALELHIHRIVHDMEQVKHQVNQSLHHLIASTELTRDGRDLVRLWTSDAVYFSDTAVDSDATKQLQHEVDVLESCREGERVWAPTQRGPIRFLVDPLKYPFIDRETRRIPCFGEQSYLDPYTQMSAIMHRGSIHSRRYPWAFSFYWVSDELYPRPTFPPRGDFSPEGCDLPDVYEDQEWVSWVENPVSRTFSLVTLDPLVDDYVYCQRLPSEFFVDEGGHVTIESYINNLHPLACRQLYCMIERVFEQMVPAFDGVLSSLLEAFPEPWFVSEWSKPYVRSHLSPRPGFPHSPEPPRGGSHTTFTMKGHRVQVIVSMVEIQLDAETPEFYHEQWHIDARKVERVVASGLYCFGMENLTECRIALRSPVNPPFTMQQDLNSMAAIYGFTPQTDPVIYQDAGSVSIEEGRSVTWPNYLEHQLLPFNVKDKSMPGKLQLLRFMIVDPFHPILSTRDVPPQQLQWTDAGIDAIARKYHLPDAVLDLIQSMTRFGLSAVQAEEERVKVEASSVLQYL